QGSPSFARQVQIFVNQTKANRFLLIYVLFTLFQGFQLASLESYWQPYLKSLLTSKTDFWFLGALGSSLFLVSIIGSVLGKSLMSRGRPSRLFLLGMGLSFLFEAALPFVPSIATFCLPYVLIYLNLGIASVVGGCLLNDSLDSSVRSSSLSLNSFALQIGGIFSILLAMVVLRHGAIGRLWILTSAICMLFLLVISRPFLRSIQDQRHNKTQEEREGKTERKGYGIEDLVQPQNENS
ncbi:MAG: MFS transporter, partial [Sphaerochaetaceae bacterium]